MGKKGKNKRIGVVYSTNDDFDYSHEGDAVEETLPVVEQELSVHIEKKGRGGKAVVIVKGFIGNHDDLQDLAKLLKKKCGVGGSAKDGEILIQGDDRPQVMKVLEKEGYSTKRVGG